MFKKLSNSEYKYRLKIINSYHLNKLEQRIIDKQAEYSYKELYNNPSELMRILFDYGGILQAFKDLSFSAGNATTAFTKLAEVIKNVL